MTVVAMRMSNFVNGVAQLQRLIRQVEDQPMEASDGRTVPASTFVGVMYCIRKREAQPPVEVFTLSLGTGGNPSLTPVKDFILSQREVYFVPAGEEEGRETKLQRFPELSNSPTTAQPP